LFLSPSTVRLLYLAEIFVHHGLRPDCDRYISRLKRTGHIHVMQELLSAVFTRKREVGRVSEVLLTLMKTLPSPRWAKTLIIPLIWIAYCQHKAAVSSFSFQKYTVVTDVTVPLFVLNCYIKTHTLLAQSTTWLKNTDTARRWSLSHFFQSLLIVFVLGLWQSHLHFLVTFLFGDRSVYSRGLTHWPPAALGEGRTGTKVNLRPCVADALCAAPPTNLFFQYVKSQGTTSTAVSKSMRKWELVFFSFFFQLNGKSLLSHFTLTVGKRYWARPEKRVNHDGNSNESPNLTLQFLQASKSILASFSWLFWFEGPQQSCFGLLFF